MSHGAGDFRAERKRGYGISSARGLDRFWGRDGLGLDRGKSKAKSRFPAGMTTKKARARATGNGKGKGNGDCNSSG